jgi:hypothetical protein
MYRGAAARVCRDLAVERDVCEVAAGAATAAFFSLLGLRRVLVGRVRSQDPGTDRLIQRIEDIGNVLLRALDQD